MDAKDPHIRSQNNAYRRGMILGLTMAEIMVLVLFALLLALAAALAKKNSIIAARDLRIAALANLEIELGELFRNGAKGISVTDIIQRLERQQKENADLKKEADRLKPYEANAKAVEDVIREIKQASKSDATPQEIAEKLQQTAQLMKENQTFKGQIVQLSSQIRAAGRGNEFPSCWVTPGGKAQSIFELWITANGIVIKDHYLADRVSDKADLPLSQVRYGTELSRQDFLGDTNPLYQWSVAHQCRFYVIRYTSVDKTSVDLVNAMDAYFYPDSAIKFRASGP